MYTTITYIILKTGWYAISIIKGLCLFYFPLLPYNESKNSYWPVDVQQILAQTTGK